MRKFLRAAGLLLGLVVLAVWFFGGPNLGWTKNAVPRVVKDPVTELEVNVFEKRFVPGVDFLAGGLLLAAALAGSSFFFRKRRDQRPEDDAKA